MHSGLYEDLPYWVGLACHALSGSTTIVEAESIDRFPAVRLRETRWRRSSSRAPALPSSRLRE